MNMMRRTTFRFERNPEQNTDTVDALIRSFERKHPGRTVAITHEILGEVARIRCSLVPLMDPASADKDNFDLGTVEVPVEQHLTANQIFTEANERLRDLEERER